MCSFPAGECSGLICVHDGINICADSAGLWPIFDHFEPTRRFICAALLTLVGALGIHVYMMVLILAPIRSVPWPIFDLVDLTRKLICAALLPLDDALGLYVYLMVLISPGRL